MARSKRRSKKSFSRQKADWVYRPNFYDEAGGTVDALGTYDAHTKSLASGFGAAIGAVLYDSHNRRNFVVNQLNFATILPGYARAEGSMPFIKWVRGMIYFSPTTWALGDAISLGLRFGMFEQDAASGQFLLDANYNMWSPASADMNVAPAHWANTRTWQREFRKYYGFSDNARVFNAYFSFPVKRRLRPHECYGVYMETGSGSATANVGMMLSTLVADEG